jgi:hypothetical protein
MFTCLLGVSSPTALRLCSASVDFSDSTEVSEVWQSSAWKGRAIVRYGRSEEEWARLTDVGTKFLIERATMQRTTSYTELNAALINRTDTAGFNFDLDAERAAIGELLGQISEDTVAETGGLLISALVQYLDANDAGPGFFTLAKSKGLPVPTTTDDRQLFCAGHVEALHKHYARARRGESQGEPSRQAST